MNSNRASYGLVSVHSEPFRRVATAKTEAVTASVADQFCFRCGRFVCSVPRPLLENIENAVKSWREFAVCVHSKAVFDPLVENTALEKLARKTKNVLRFRGHILVSGRVPSSDMMSTPHKSLTNSACDAARGSRMKTLAYAILRIRRNSVWKTAKLISFECARDNKLNK